MCQSILVRVGKLEWENACTCLRWPWGCIPHLEFSWLVMWLVSRTLALAAGARENSWCVAVAMTQTNALSQTNRRWHNSFMAAGHARASRPNNRGDVKVREQCTCQAILLKWALWLNTLEACGAHPVDRNNLSGNWNSCALCKILFL